MSKKDSIHNILDDIAKNGNENPQISTADFSLTSYLDQLSKENFKKTNVVYIDQDVHEVISRLKRNKKFSMGNLFSMLGKEFIEKFDSEIKDSLTNNNKYLP